MSDIKDIPLLEQIEKILEIEREEGETAEAYKERIARAFTSKYPNTPEGNAAYDELAAGVTDWVDAASEAVRKNKSARKKARLPELEGLEEDPKDEKTSSRGSRNKSGDDNTSGSGRGGGQKRELAATFEPAPEGALVSKFLTKVFKEHNFTKQKDRSEAGHIVYKQKDTDKEIHVGPGKTEQAYLMGWRAPGQEKHSYGADSLEKYLSGK